MGLIEVSESAIPRRKCVGVCGPLRKTIPCAIHDQSLCSLFPIYIFIYIMTVAPCTAARNIIYEVFLLIALWLKRLKNHTL